MMMESVSKKSTLFENIGPPLLQLTVYLRYLRINLLTFWRRGGPMFSKRVDFFETDSINIQYSLHIFDLKWNHISEVQIPVSPCCYFTSFEIITAREKSPLHLDRRFWEISLILDVKDNSEFLKNIWTFWNFLRFWKFWKCQK